MLIAIKHVVKHRRVYEIGVCLFCLAVSRKEYLCLMNGGNITDRAGAYVYPDMLNEHSIVYSFGVSADISFDADIIERHNCKVFGFDLNPRSIAWVECNIMPEKFLF